MKKQYSFRAILESDNLLIDSSFGCSCVDRDGFPKILYPTFKDAQKAKDGRSWLKIYPCPEKIGFHLSSS